MAHANPLNATDIDALNEAQRLMRPVMDKIRKAEACGIDCTPYKQMYEQVNAQIDAMRQHYSDTEPVANRQ